MSAPILPETGHVTPSGSPTPSSAMTTRCVTRTDQANNGILCRVLSLMGEINRAETVADRAAQLGSIVTTGSWVMWTSWGIPRETRQLVYPEEYRVEESQIQCCHHWARP